MSVRLLVLVEGATEEGFVNRVLRPHLWSFHVFAEAKQVTTRYRRGQVVGKGGGRHYRKWKEDFERLRKQDPNPDRWFTSMVDLYGLAKLADDFPGYEAHKNVTDPYERIAALEAAFKADIGDYQFEPYIQLHEYEALVLADPQKLDVEYLEHAEAIANLVHLCGGYDSPELINEGEDTAPSKRIINEIAEYAFNKPRVGVLVAERIGLAALRAKCPHFNDWIGRLERLGGTEGGS
jgi:hypothetical protein